MLIIWLFLRVISSLILETVSFPLKIRQKPICKPLRKQEAEYTVCILKDHISMMSNSRTWVWTANVSQLEKGQQISVRNMLRDHHSWASYRTKIRTWNANIWFLWKGKPTYKSCCCNSLNSIGFFGEISSTFEPPNTLHDLFLQSLDGWYSFESRKFNLGSHGELTAGGGPLNRCMASDKNCLGICWAALQWGQLNLCTSESLSKRATGTTQILGKNW